MKFGTKVIHAGIEPDPSTGAVMTAHLSDLDLRAKGTGRPPWLRICKNTEPHPGRTAKQPRSLGKRSSRHRLQQRYGSNGYRHEIAATG